jgi:H+/Cl- antiporter ClcA
MSANPDPRHEARESYTYRRQLSGRDLLPAIAIGVGAGLLAFYVARLFAQRTQLLESPPPAPRIRTRSAGVAG